jgi:hypothetical protein
MSSREDLRKKLKEKLEQKQLQRTSKKVVEKKMSDCLETLNIDFEKFKKDLETVNKSGGLTINTTNK